MPQYTLTEFKPNQIWIKEYPIHYAGCHLQARMSVIRLHDGKLLLHSPCEIDRETKAEIDALGQVSFIFAPGNYHYFYVSSAQKAYPQADTFICPGVERKRPELEFEGFLSDHPDPRWAEDFDQALVRGNRLMWEVAFCHKSSRTLILVDLIENITDETPNTNLTLKFWWKIVFNMWNKPKPAPEYRMGWKDKMAAKKSLLRILGFDFDSIILAHGDLVEADGKHFARKAWRTLLGDKAKRRNS